MKTNDLIKMLQEADPSGELEVVVGNVPIHFIAPEPAYWDGCYRRLIREPHESNEIYYDVTGIEFVSQGTKLVIHTLDYDMILLDDCNAQVKYDTEQTRNKYESVVEKKRKELIDMKQGLESDSFATYVTKRLNKDTPAIRDAAKKWALDNIRHDAEMPEDIDAMGKPTAERYGLSWNSRRELQWNREIGITEEDGKVVFTKIIKSP